MIFLVVIGAVVLIVLLVQVARAAAERERRRKAVLAEWAGQNGFTFDEADRFNLASRFLGVEEIGRGHDQYAFEVLSRFDPAPIYLFRYHFATTETRTVTRNGRTETETYEKDHWRKYLIVELGAPFPALAIREESWFDKLAGFIGFDDIDFESEAFSSKFHCKSENRQFAYAVIHPQMMEWLLARPLSVSLHNGLLVMALSGGEHTWAECYNVLSLAAGFVARIPPFVWEDYARSQPLSLPQPSPLVLRPMPAR